MWICTVVRYFCSFTIISAGQSKELDGSKMSCTSVGAHVEKEKAYSTWYSQAVSHPSTNQARPCLASEIRRDWACFFLFLLLSKIHILIYSSRENYSYNHSSVTQNLNEIPTTRNHEKQTKTPKRVTLTGSNQSNPIKITKTHKPNKTKTVITHSHWVIQIINIIKTKTVITHSHWVIQIINTIKQKQ